MAKLSTSEIIEAIKEMKILEGFIRCYAMRCGIQPKQILDLNIKLEK